MSENQKKLNSDFYARESTVLLTNPLYKGKFVVIHNQELKGSFDSFNNALQFATSNLPLEEFIIQQVIDENEQINFVRSAI